MKIAFRDAQPIVDAADLGPLLGLEPREVQQKMRKGEITSRYEVGEGEDAGRVRLTFYYQNTRLRLIAGTDGMVLKRIRTPVRTR